MSRLWSESQEKLFTDLWNQGVDTNVIGARMAEVGRPLASSSVIDRARRMQLEPRNALPPLRTNGWTVEEEIIVTKLWGEGQSASQIAVVISGKRRKRVSRSAVIGKVHRLGLPKRAVPKAPRFTKPKTKRAFGQEKRNNGTSNHMVTPRPKKTKKPLPRAAKADQNRVGPTLEQLKPNSCRWPIGMNTRGEWMFCGEEAEHNAGSGKGQPYCCHHLARSKSNMSDEQREQLSESAKRRTRYGTFIPQKKKAA